MATTSSRCSDLVLVYLDTVESFEEDASCSPWPNWWYPLHFLGSFLTPPVSEASHARIRRRFKTRDFQKERMKKITAFPYCSHLREEHNEPACVRSVHEAIRHKRTIEIKYYYYCYLILESLLTRLSKFDSTWKIMIPSPLVWSVSACTKRDKNQNTLDKCVRYG